MRSGEGRKWESCLSPRSAEETTVISISVVACSMMLWQLSNELVCSACPGAFSWSTTAKVNRWITSKCSKGLGNNSAAFKILEKMNDWLHTVNHPWRVFFFFQRNNQCSFETCWISSCCIFLAASEIVSSYFPKCSNSHEIGKAMLAVNLCLHVSA